MSNRLANKGQKLLPDTAETPLLRRKGRAVKGGEKVRLLSWDSIDARTVAFRQAVELRNEYLDYARGAENGVDVREQAEAAALLAAMRKDRAARWFGGEDVAYGEVCTLVNSESRALANLREWRSKAGDNALDLKQYLAATERATGAGANGAAPRPEAEHEAPQTLEASEDGDGESER